MKKGQLYFPNARTEYLITLRTSYTCCHSEKRKGSYAATLDGKLLVGRIVRTLGSSKCQFLYGKMTDGMS
jgi:hypothetical protein